jgi:hypothetical protein
VPQRSLLVRTYLFGYCDLFLVRQIILAASVNVLQEKSVPVINATTITDGAKPTVKQGLAETVFAGK